MLLQRVEQVLEERDFVYSHYRGCFDLAARRDTTLLLKVLTNVDSFQKHSANSLKMLSNALDAGPMIIGEKTRRERLDDDVLYERFGVPTLTPDTFASVLSGSMPFLCRGRGGVFVNVNPDKLRAAREASGLSQSQLAEEVGVTKKSIYEHESRVMRALHESASRIEEVLDAPVTDPATLESGFDTSKNDPKGGFEARVFWDLASAGFDVDFIYSAPFNLIARERRMFILSEAEKSRRTVERKLPALKGFSDLTGSDVMVVTSEDIETDVPSVSEKKLREMSKRDIKKLISRF